MDWESCVPEHRWDIELSKWNVNKNTAKKNGPLQYGHPTENGWKQLLNKWWAEDLRVFNKSFINITLASIPPIIDIDFQLLGNAPHPHKCLFKDSRACLCVWLHLGWNIFLWSCAPVLWFRPCTLEYAWGLWVLPSLLCRPWLWWSHRNQIKSSHHQKIKDDIKEVCKHPAGHTRGWCTAHKSTTTWR